MARRHQQPEGQAAVYTPAEQHRHIQARTVRLAPAVPRSTGSGQSGGSLQPSPLMYICRLGKRHLVSPSQTRTPTSATAPGTTARKECCPAAQHLLLPAL